MSALQEDVVRLHQQLDELRRRLSDELMGKMDPVETFELVTQTLSNMATTSSRNRRRLMSNVVVNGLEDVAADQVERRLLVRAVADLDMAHVDLLRRLTKDLTAGREWDPEQDRVLAHDLLRHGLLVDRDPFVFGGEGFGAGAGFGDGSGGSGRQAHVSERGRRFLAYLAEPVTEVTEGPDFAEGSS